MLDVSADVGEVSRVPRMLHLHENCHSAKSISGGGFVPLSAGCRSQQVDQDGAEQPVVLGEPLLQVFGAEPFFVPACHKRERSVVVAGRPYRWRGLRLSD
jgi:hypothetical protein